MRYPPSRNRQLSLILTICLATIPSAAFAQGAAFTYQGRLTDGGSAANGQYDLQFQLFAAASGGRALGAVTLDEVQVTNGVFTVQLDFGATNFQNGAAQFLEIAVRPGNATGAYATLTPRQPITATPYALRSASSDLATNASQLGGLAANQYVLTSDARLNDDRAPKAGSSNYIQNTTTAQAGASFNIAGNGTLGGTLAANTVNVATQYNIGGNRVLSAPGLGNVFAGQGAGQSNTTGSGNSFFGDGAGFRNTTGLSNASFGNFAGFKNTVGSANSFFGANAGLSATSDQNTFIGAAAGQQTTTGAGNVFVGFISGQSNLTGANNTFVGRQSGIGNSAGDNNTFIGATATGPDGLTNATAIGAGSNVTQSDSLILGANASVGIGVSAPKAKLHVAGGDLYIGSTNQGVILKSPNGQVCRRLGIDNAGNIVLTTITCP